MNEKELLTTELATLRQTVKDQRAEILNRSSHILAGFIDVVMATIVMADSGDPRAKAQLAKLTNALERAKESASKIAIARNGS